MGYDGYGVDNALDGHEAEVIEAIDARDPPRWVDADDLADDIEFATARAEQNREDWIERHGEEPDYVGQVTSLLSYDIDLDRTPTEVRERLEEWLEENRDHYEYRDGADFVDFRYFALGVRITPEGEVDGVDVTAWFKNH